MGHDRHRYLAASCFCWLVAFLQDHIWTPQLRAAMHQTPTSTKLQRAVSRSQNFSGTWASTSVYIYSYKQQQLIKAMVFSLQLPLLAIFCVSPRNFGLSSQWYAWKSADTPPPRLSANTWVDRGPAWEAASTCWLFCGEDNNKKNRVLHSCWRRLSLIYSPASITAWNFWWSLQCFPWLPWNPKKSWETSCNAGVADTGNAGPKPQGFSMLDPLGLHHLIRSATRSPKGTFCTSISRDDCFEDDAWDSPSSP